MSLDLLNPNILKEVFGEIRGIENLERKREAYECLQIYKERQKELICRELRKEYGQESQDKMRKFTSLNLTRRIVHSEASIYKKAPERMLSEGASENEITQFENLYHFADANKKLKIANRYKVLFSQCALQVIPKNGILRTRVLTPFHYDVIPMWDDPEAPMAYIIQMNSRPGNMINNQFDFEIQMTSEARLQHGDLQNQIIADEDDDLLNALRYVVWTDQLNFIADGKGQIINPETDEPFNGSITDDDVLSPLHEDKILPFIDIADQKDFEFWVDRGCQLAEFALDIGKMDSDTAEINRLQGYSQPIISATEMPQQTTVGPSAMLFLQKKPNGDPAKDPEFSFASPNPDLDASIKLRNAFINTFLTSRGLDKSVINTDGEGQSYSSGVERHLAKIERFEESQDDLDLFKRVEDDYFMIMRAWSNKLQGVSVEEGGLRAELQNGQIREELEMTVKFETPEMIQTKREEEESHSRKLKEGSMSLVEVVMEQRGVEEDKAIEILEKIQEHKSRFGSSRGMLESLRSRMNVEQETPENITEQ